MLIFKGCALGTSHPPGYPLYTLIVYLVTTLGKTWFPILPPAYIVNITSCILGSISAGLIALVIYKLTKDDGGSSICETSQLKKHMAAMCSMTTALMWAFSPLNWQYNTSAEVFALNNSFVSMILYVLSSIARKMWNRTRLR